MYRHEIDEQTRTLKLWVRRKGGNQVLVCSGCGGRARKIEEVRERMVRDLPWRKYQAIVVVEFYRVRCPQCGLKVEQVPQLPGKAAARKIPALVTQMGVDVNLPRQKAEVHHGGE